MTKCMTYNKKKFSRNFITSMRCSECYETETK